MRNVSNDYYTIGMNDYQFVLGSQTSDYYNKLSVDMQQVAEKLLKSIVETEVDDIDVGIQLLHTHNLNVLYDELKKHLSDVDFDENVLAFLSSCYINARYPGDNFILISKDKCERFSQLLSEIVSYVESYRRSKGLPIMDLTTMEMISTAGNGKQSFEGNILKYLDKFLPNSSAAERTAEVDRLKNIYNCSDEDLSKYIEADFDLN